jgi:hypothetical protein
MKIFCIPITREAWAYFAIHPNPKSVWEVFEGFRKKPGRGWQLLASFGDKLRNEFEEMRRAPAGSFKSRMFNASRKILDRAHPDEDFFKTLSVRDGFQRASDDSR